MYKHAQSTRCINSIHALAKRRNKNLYFMIADVVDKMRYLTTVSLKSCKKLEF